MKRDNQYRYQGSRRREAAGLPGQVQILERLCGPSVLGTMSKVDIK